MPTPASQLALYRYRRDNRLCVNCGAGLQEGDGVTCVEHAEANRRTSAAYGATARGLEKLASRRAKVRAARLALDLCVDCPVTNIQSAEPGRELCTAHRVAKKLAAIRRAEQRESASCRP